MAAAAAQRDGSGGDWRAADPDKRWCWRLGGGGTLGSGVLGLGWLGSSKRVQDAVLFFHLPGSRPGTGESEKSGTGFNSY